MRIRNFTDLEAWKQAHALVITIYKVTRKYPKDEQFGIINQMRRAVVSVTSNIAEGFSRGTLKDKGHFYAIAKGSLTEVENQLIISKDVGYLSLQDFAIVEGEVRQANRLLTGLIRYTKGAKGEHEV